MRILTQILPEHLVIRSWPLNMREEEFVLFVNEQNVELPSVNLCEFEHSVIDPSGIVMKRLNVDSECLIWESHRSTYNRCYAARKYFFSKHRKLNKNITPYLCFDYWSNGYFHWISEALPRIFLIEEELKNKNAVLVLPEKFKFSFQSETLFAFPGIRIEWIGDNELLHCRKGRLVSRLGKSGSNNPAIVREVRSRLISRSGLHSVPFRNVYISRRLASRRKVENEAEVEKLLIGLGFEIIHFEDYSFAEQLRIACESRNYISIHGANLTNSIFMEAGTNVLEFRMRNDPDNNYYYALTTACNINYYFLPCDFKMLSEEGNNFNLKVDITELEKIVLQMINK